MKNIEDFIKENRNLFDEEEPQKEHFERFSKKLNKTGKTKIRNIYLKSLKYAAIIVVIFTASFFVNKQFGLINKQKANNKENIITDEFTEASNYYAGIVNEKLSELNNLECKIGEEPKKSVKNDIVELNKSYAELENELESKPENTHIKNAIIQNYKMRIEVLNIVISKIKTYC